jgi:L-alanine-DL-glutamate epimerase-like enolase superfamily enzyme
MHVARIETAWIEMPLPMPRGLSIGPITHSIDAVCRITTSSGVQGIGESRGGPLAETCEIIDAVFKPKLLGRHAAETEHLWQLMHETLLGPEAPTHRWARRTVLGAIAAVDMALWDIKAKAAGLPLCQLLGGQPREVPAYYSDGFYTEGQSLDALAPECAEGLEAGGFRSLKMRIGRDPDDDVARVRAVRRAIGPDTDLMVDINQAWDRAQAEATLPRLEEFGLYWLEEPTPVSRPADDYAAPDRLVGEIARGTSIPLASGENHISLAECRSLIENAPLRFMQFDAIKNGGVTEFLRVASLCRAYDVLLAPHHVPHFHVQLVAALSNALILEVFDNTKQHVAWPELFPGYPEVRNGAMRVPDRPGWGMSINDDLIEAHGVKVCWSA